MKAAKGDDVSSATDAHVENSKNTSSSKTRENKKESPPNHNVLPSERDIAQGRQNKGACVVKQAAKGVDVTSATDAQVENFKSNYEQELKASSPVELVANRERFILAGEQELETYSDTHVIYQSSLESTELGSDWISD
jgi:hypothetical protein